MKKQGPTLFLLRCLPWVALLAGCASAPPPAAAVTFAALGDAPYTSNEVERLDAVIDEINRAAPAFVVHVGDIGAGAKACTDAWLQARKAQFARIRAPFVLVPGDNEWTDCDEPLARLRSWRALFCGPTLEVEVQPGEYCEHVRWERSGWVFVALNVPGSNNDARHPEEQARRMSAVFAWLDAAAARAAGRNGLVVFMQADPFVRHRRDGYAKLRARLAQLGAQRPGKVILVHGDTHLARDDEPLPGLRRIEVWGSPFVSWTPVGLE